MKRDVVCARAEDDVASVARRMRDEGIGFLPVCNENGSILGTVTDRDLAVRVLAEGRATSTPLDSIMTHEVVACATSDDVRTAARKMADHQKTRVVCLDDRNHVAGVISLSDLAQLDDHTAARTLRYVKAHA
jgi:CBS domain-containing protein